MKIRTGLTEKDIKNNMLELAMYLAKQDDDSNVIEAELLGLHMRFEMWPEGIHYSCGVTT